MENYQGCDSQLPATSNKEGNANKLPVPYEVFKKHTHYEEVVDEILKQKSNGSEKLYEEYRNSDEYKESALHQYYEAFYLKPEIRKKHPIRFRAVPMSLKEKLLKIPLLDNMDKAEVADIGNGKSCEYQKQASIVDVIPITDNTGAGAVPRKLKDTLLETPAVEDSEVNNNNSSCNIENLRFNIENTKSCEDQNQASYVHLNPATDNDKHSQLPATSNKEGNANKLPVSYEVFKKHALYEEVVDEMLKRKSNGSEKLYEEYRNSDESKESALHQYYEAFYLKPEIRKNHPIRFRAVPMSLKEKLLKIPGGASIVHLNPATDNDKYLQLPKSSINKNISQLSSAELIPYSHCCPVNLRDFKKYTNIKRLLKVAYPDTGLSRSELVRRVHLVFYLQPEKVRHRWPYTELIVKDTCPSHLKCKIFEIPTNIYLKEHNKKRDDEHSKEVVEPLNENTLLPVSYDEFKKCTYYEEVVDQMLKAKCIGNEKLYEEYKNSDEFKELTLRNYYEEYYSNPKIRKTNPIRFRAVPKKIKDKLLQMPAPKSSQINNNRRCNNENLKINIENRKSCEDPSQASIVHATDNVKPSQQTATLPTEIENKSLSNTTTHSYFGLITGSKRSGNSNHDETACTSKKSMMEYDGHTISKNLTISNIIQEKEASQQTATLPTEIENKSLSNTTTHSHFGLITGSKRSGNSNHDETASKSKKSMMEYDGHTISKNLTISNIQEKEATLVNQPSLSDTSTSASSSPVTVIENTTRNAKCQIEILENRVVVEPNPSITNTTQEDEICNSSIDSNENSLNATNNFENTPIPAPQILNTHIDTTSSLENTTRCRLSETSSDIRKLKNKKTFKKFREAMMQQLRENVDCTGFPFAFDIFTKFYLIPLEDILYDFTQQNKETTQLLLKDQEICDLVMRYYYVKYHTNPKVCIKYPVGVRYTYTSIQNELKTSKSDEKQKQKPNTAQHQLESVQEETTSSTVEKHNQQIEKDNKIVKSSPLERAKRIFFRSSDKTHALSYIIRTSIGLKHYISRALCIMTFEEFLTFTNIYEGMLFYKDDIIKTMYRYVFQTERIWPNNLFITLYDLYKFLKTKNIKFPNYSTMLKYISPKFLHWSNLRICTNYEDCVCVDYRKRTGNILNINNAALLDKECCDYYNRCWRNNDWIRQVPIVTEQLVEEFMRKDSYCNDGDVTTLNVSALQEICPQSPEPVTDMVASEISTEGTNETSLKTNNIPESTTTKAISVNEEAPLEIHNSASEEICLQTSEPVTDIIPALETQVHDSNNIVNNHNYSLLPNSQQQIDNILDSTTANAIAINEEAPLEMQVSAYQTISLQPPEPVTDIEPVTDDSTTTNAIAINEEAPLEMQVSAYQTIILQPPEPVTDIVTDLETHVLNCNNTVDDLNYVLLPNTQQQINMLPPEVMVPNDPLQHDGNNSDDSGNSVGCISVKKEPKAIKPLNNLKFVEDDNHEFQIYPCNEDTIVCLDDTILSQDVSLDSLHMSDSASPKCLLSGVVLPNSDSNDCSSFINQGQRLPSSAESTETQCNQVMRHINNLNLTSSGSTIEETQSQQQINSEEEVECIYQSSRPKEQMELGILDGDKNMSLVIGLQNFSNQTTTGTTFSEAQRFPSTFEDSQTTTTTNNVSVTSNSNTKVHSNVTVRIKRNLKQYSAKNSNFVPQKQHIKRALPKKPVQTLNNNEQQETSTAIKRAVASSNASQTQSPPVTPTKTHLHVSQELNADCTVFNNSSFLKILDQNNQLSQANPTTSPQRKRQPPILVQAVAPNEQPELPKSSSAAQSHQGAVRTTRRTSVYIDDENNKANTLSNPVQKAAISPRRTTRRTSAYIEGGDDDDNNKNCFKKPRKS